MSVRADARALLGEARRVARAARPEGVAEGLAQAVSDLETALAARDKARIRSAASAVDAYLGAHYADLRKSKPREYLESVSVAVLFALLLRALLVEPFQIPSASMEPTLLVGDFLFVSKASYGVRIPFTTRYVVRWRDVQVGDIVVFRFPVEEVQTQAQIGEASLRLETYHARNGGYPATLEDAAVPAGLRVDGWGAAMRYELVGSAYRLASSGPDGTFGTVDDLNTANSAFLNGVGSCLDRPSLESAKDYIKRVVAVAGDRVSMRENVLYVNGRAVERTDIRDVGPAVHGYPTTQATEHLTDGVTYTTWSIGMSPDFDEITVREGHVFTMGDSRDNSSDGRCWGQVPVQAVKGRAQFIFFSRDRRPAGQGGPPNVLASIRWSRFFDPVR